MQIRPAVIEDAPIIAVLVGELLNEIMAALGESVFDFDLDETTERLARFLQDGTYVVFVAQDTVGLVGFIALHESHALYAGGAFGIIPEFYVQPAYRSQRLGAELLAHARSFGRSRQWTRLEVTTPPLPAFGRTLAFYEREGFAITGGRKLKVVL